MSQLEADFYDQLLTANPRFRLSAGLGMLFVGAAIGAWMWERGLVVGISVVLVVGGLLVTGSAWTDLRRQRLLEAEIDRAEKEWEQLLAEGLAARAEGQSVARLLQARGFTDAMLRRALIDRIDAEHESRAGA